MSLLAKVILRQAAGIALLSGAVLAAAGTARSQDLLPQQLRGASDASPEDVETDRTRTPSGAGRLDENLFPGRLDDGASAGRPRGDALDADADLEPGLEEATTPAAEAEVEFDLFEGPAEPATPLNPPTPAASRAAASTQARPAPESAAADRAPSQRNAGPAEPARRITVTDPVVTTGIGTPLPVGAVDQPRLDQAGRLNPAAPGSILPVPPREDDPFAPLGLRAGTFILYSTLEQSLGYSSNLDKVPEGEAGAYSDTALSVQLLSDWSRHQAEVNASVGYRRNFSGEAEENPRAAAEGRLRLDVDRDTTATFRGALAYRREDASELSGLGGVSTRPEVLNASASATVERRFGRFVFGATGSAAREAYFDQSGSFPEKSFSTFTGAIRGGYELSPALQPFVEASLGRRLVDQERDQLGRGRDSMIQTVRAGLRIDFADKLSGEAAVGYARNLPDDDALPAVGTPTFDARIDWSPQRGTDVTLSAATTFDPDATDLSTKVNYDAALSVRHRIAARTDLTADLSFKYSDSDVAGEDEATYGAGAGFTYWLNRSLAFTGSVSHEQLRAETSQDDYGATTAQLGIRLQR